MNALKASLIAALALLLQQLFIDAQLFWLMLVILLSDFITGVARALYEKTFSWRKLPRFLFKLVLYAVIYADVKALCLIYEWLPDLDKIVMSLILMKEVISTLQNWRAIVGGGGFTDLAINFLRLDVFHTVLKKTQSEIAQPECLQSNLDNNKTQSQGDT